LAGYEAWAERCPERLLGDFAFAIWDGRKRQLFCARDVLGMKPFYYYVDERLFLFASEIPVLFAHGGLIRDRNDRMIAEYLSGHLESREETLYRGIVRLPPAHCMLVQAGREVRKHCFWQPDPRREIRYGADGEYADHFLSLLRSAVRCRLRSDRPVLAELSGGLDSSTVVAVTQSLVKEGRGPVAGFEAFSLVFPGLDCDESRYIDAVAEKTGVRVSRFQVPVTGPGYYRKQARQFEDFPGYPNGGAMLRVLSSAAHDMASRVVLTGDGGDDWLTGSRFRYADLLCDFRLGELLREYVAESAKMRRRTALKSLWTYGLRPVLPRLLPRPLLDLLRRTRLRRRPPTLAADFWRSTRRERHFASSNEIGSLAKRELLWMYEMAFRPHLNEMQERNDALFGLVRRHPLHDRRLIEFALALPTDQLWRHGRTKQVLRRAMVPLLPEVVLSRTDKAEFSHLFGRAIESFVTAGELQAKNVAATGWLDPAGVRKALANWEEARSHGFPQHSLPGWELWYIIGLDIWLASAFWSE
jgi:asparagine synthase (glutamine-hydrolysing)